MPDELPGLPPDAFARIDEGDDAAFYAPPRLVTHIDDAAIAALGAFYAEVLPPDAVLLDLMSSWVSHLPNGYRARAVIGHGMNMAELEANPVLTRRFVQDLNRDTRLPVGDDECDGAMCCVSVQYLQRPVEVFREVRRVLEPGAPFVVSYSNRCFPTKAVQVWRMLDLRGHASLIGSYFAAAGFAGIEVRVLANGMDGDPLVAVVGQA